MNWDAVGAISETVGVVVVVTSVWYLAVQIRKQTDEARMTATRDLARDWNELNADLSRDPELIRLYREAIFDIDGLEDNERLQFGFLMNRGFRCFEQHYLHFSRETIETPYVDSINSRMREMLSFPGIQLWWERNRLSYEVNFQEHVDSLKSEAKAAGYQSSFEKKA